MTDRTFQIETKEDWTVFAPYCRFANVWGQDETMTEFCVFCCEAENKEKVCGFNPCPLRKRTKILILNEEKLEKKW